MAGRRRRQVAQGEGNWPQEAVIKQTRVRTTPTEFNFAQHVTNPFFPTQNIELKIFVVKMGSSLSFLYPRSLGCVHNSISGRVSAVR